MHDLIFENNATWLHQYLTEAWLGLFLLYQFQCGTRLRYLRSAYLGPLPPEYLG